MARVKGVKVLFETNMHVHIYNLKSTSVTVVYTLFLHTSLQHVIAGSTVESGKQAHALITLGGKEMCAY